MVVDEINKWAKRTPTKPAVIHNGLEMSYLQFAKCIESARRYLKGQDIPSHTTAIVVAKNNLDAWIAVISARANGLTSICIPSSDKLTELDIKNASCLITIQGDDFTLLNSPAKRANIRVVQIPASIFSMDVLNSITGLSSSNHFVGDHIALTSSSTGISKKVLIKSKFEKANSEYLAFTDDISGNTEINLLSLAISSLTCYRLAIAVWYVGGVVVIEQTGDIFSSLRRKSTTILRLTPSFTKEFIYEYKGRVDHNENLTAYNGGGFIPFESLMHIKNRLGCNLVWVYSSTELCNRILSTFIETPEDLIWQKVLPGREIEIVDEFDNLVSANVEGRIRIKLNEMDAEGYLDDTVATSQSYRSGYFYPGDIAVRRDDQRVRIIGRVSNVLIIDGHKYAVGPIEDDLRSRLKVRDLCLFGRQNAHTENELFILMECDGLPSKSDLQSIQRDFQMFRKIHFWPFHRFPRNAGGKTDRLMLQRFVYKQADKELII